MFSFRLDFGRRPDPAAMRAELKRRVELGTARAAQIVLGALRRYSASELLHARTGTLAREWALKKGEGPYSYVAVNRSPYARVHEYGGTITPKRARMLAIPVGPALTARGVPRYVSPRDVPGLFVVRSRAGNLILAKRIGKDRLEAWYALKESVTLPARHYASEAVKAAEPTARAEIGRALKE